MSKVLYLLWWEGSKQVGLINNVVYRQIEEISKDPRHEIHLLSAAPFWRGALFRWLEGNKLGRKFLGKRINKWTNTTQLGKRLRNQNITPIFRQTILRPPSLYLSWFRLLTHPLPHVIYLHLLCKRLKIDIVHCRSYFPALLTLITRSCFRSKFVIIFDTRGLLPDEGVSTGFFSARSLSYRLWRCVEKKLLCSVDMVVNVSETFTEHLLENRVNLPMQTIYAPVDLSAFNTTSISDESATNKPFYLAYLGSISDNSWHSPIYLAKAYLSFRKKFGRTGLLLITATEHEMLRSILRKEGIQDDEIRIVSANSLPEVSKYLNLAFYGCLPYRKIRDIHDENIAKTMISTKMTEYLAAGLPILSNSNIGGASELIQKYGLGTIIDLEGCEFESDSTKWIDPRNDTEIKSRCLRIAQEFSLNVIARKYTDLYETLGRTNSA